MVMLAEQFGGMDETDNGQPTSIEELLKRPLPWEQARELFVREFPNVDVEELRQRYEAAVKLRKSREQFAGMQEKTLAWLGRRAIPFASGILPMLRSHEYSKAMQRYKEGTSKEEDYDLIAAYERLEELDAQQYSTFTGALKDVAARIPAFVGEAVTGGMLLRGAGAAMPFLGRIGGVVQKLTAAAGRAVSRLSPTAGKATEFTLQSAARGAPITPFMPSVYGPTAAAKAARTGTSPLEAQNIVPAMMYAGIQNIVTGSIPMLAQGVKDPGARFISQVGLAAAEMELAQLMAGAVDDLLPQTWQLDAGYGIMSSILRGKHGEALQTAAIDLLSAAAFVKAGNAISRIAEQPDTPSRTKPPAEITYERPPAQEAAAPDAGQTGPGKRTDVIDVEYEVVTPAGAMEPDEAMQLVRQTIENVRKAAKKGKPSPEAAEQFREAARRILGETAPEEPPVNDPRLQKLYGQLKEVARKHHDAASKLAALPADSAQRETASRSVMELERKGVQLVVEINKRVRELVRPSPEAAPEQKPAALPELSPAATETPPPPPAERPAPPLETAPPPPPETAAVTTGSPESAPVSAERPPAAMPPEPPPAVLPRPVRRVEPAAAEIGQVEPPAAPTPAQLAEASRQAAEQARQVMPPEAQPRLPDAGPVETGTEPTVPRGTPPSPAETTGLEVPPPQRTLPPPTSAVQAAFPPPASSVQAALPSPETPSPLALAYQRPAATQQAVAGAAAQPPAAPVARAAGLLAEDPMSVQTKPKDRFGRWAYARAQRGFTLNDALRAGFKRNATVEKIRRMLRSGELLPPIQDEAGNDVYFYNRESVPIRPEDVRIWQPGDENKTPAQILEEIRQQKIAQGERPKARFVPEPPEMNRLSDELGRFFEDEDGQINVDRIYQFFADNLARPVWQAVRNVFTNRPLAQMPPLAVDNSHILPRPQPYADLKIIASTPFGTGLWGALGRILDRRARAESPVQQAILARLYTVNMGRGIASLNEAGLRAQFGRLFPPNPDGTVRLENGQNVYLEDVVRDELRRPYSAPLSPAERNFVHLGWKPLYEDAIELLRSEGMTHVIDDDGVKVRLRPDYFPRPAIGKQNASVSPLENQRTYHFGERHHATEADGVRAGVIYEPDAFRRIGMFIEFVYRNVANRRLLNDPDVSAVPRKLQKRVWLEWEPIQGAGAFSSYVFPASVARQLQKEFGQTGFDWLSAVSSATAATKTLLTGFDLSLPFVQGLLAFTSQPKQWARGVKAAFSAMLDGNYQKAVFPDQRRIDMAREYIQAGGSLAYLPDQFEALQRGSVVTRMPYLGSVAERIGVSFSSFIDAGKLELWEALRNLAGPSRYVELANYIDALSLTGRYRGRVSYPQQVLERLIIMSPMYQRAFLDLMAYSVQNNLSGQLTRTALAKFAAFVTLTSVGGMVLAGLEDNEIAERLNPASPTFLKIPVRIGDDTVEVGFGNTITSFVRFLGDLTEYYATDAPVNLENHPLLRFVRGKSTFLPRMLADLYTGRDFLGNRTTVSETLLRSITPLAMQSLFDAEGTTAQNVGVTLFTLFGAQSFPGNRKLDYMREVESKARQMFKKDYESLTLQQQRAVILAVPRQLQADSSPDAVEWAVRYFEKRGELLMRQLSDSAREKLNRLGYKLPGYSSILSLNGVDVPLTDMQLNYYHQALVDEYERQIERWDVERMLEVLKKSEESERPEAGRRSVTRFLEKSLSIAKERARARLAREFSKPNRASGSEQLPE